jgi:NADH dehydrogenase FAD-containing subunit
MKKHLVLVGGGHAHLTVIKHIDAFVEKGHDVTLISPTTHHYYSGMGPGVLSGIYRPQQIWFNVRKMALDRGASFVQGVVAKVDAEHNMVLLDSGDDVGYDVVSFNTGSEVPMRGIEGFEEHIFPVKPIENLIKARQTIRALLQQKPVELLVVGGGPAGLEIAGNLWRLGDDSGGRARIRVLAGRKFMPDCPDKVRQSAMISLGERDIEVVESATVREFSKRRALLEDGREYLFDAVLLAWGIRPSPLFRDSGMPTDETGGLLVNAYLQSIAYPEIFGGGDCIGFQPMPLDKVGVYPVRENPILYHNLLAAITGADMKPFEPQDSYLLIFNLGNGKAIYWKNRLVFSGKTAFLLKDYIDRKFMKNFQVSGELSESQKRTDE